MHISKIELENIKSHASSTYEFARGTTAITGENGAGKTTIIEAIAWVLFDLLEYKKEDFVLRGAKKGSVRVTFESGLDERAYVVYRDSGAGYHVTDPAIGTRIADKKEEVFRFLWQHLGLEPGTDLRSLFRQAIGVPQGTFTAIFLEGATERKVAFDRLLKVEEYRQASEKLRDTSRYIDTSIAGVREDIARGEGELARSETITTEYRSYGKQTKTLGTQIEALETEIAERRKLVAWLDEVEQIERSLLSVRADRTRAQEELDNIERARREIESLRPNVAEQERLESEAREFREKIAVARAVEDQVKTLDERIARLRERYKDVRTQLRDAEERSAAAGGVAELEKRDAELLRHVAGLRASLERDEKFQSEIKGGLCPILSQKCLNLEPGQTLEGFVTSQFTEIRSHIGELELEHQSIITQLRTARDAERFAAALSGLRQRETELKTEGIELAAERETLVKRLDGVDELRKHLGGIDVRLRTLDDPRSRIRFLEEQAARETTLREDFSRIETNLARLETDRRAVVEELEKYKAVFPGGAAYDRELYTAERSAFHEAEKHHAQLRATFNAAKQREEQLEAELKHLSEVRTALDGERREQERLGHIAEATSFIRDTLKTAGPIVAKNYIRHVSVEANQMFREITGNAEHSLEWAEDYSIILEEGGYKRPFVSLSGGEQMAAALSVRLALLKQLSDIRIAFFDEPTTNMDAERRENFAMQISRITHFDQLFVISHDDTFEPFADHVISLDDAGLS